MPVKIIQSTDTRQLVTRLADDLAGDGRPVFHLTHILTPNILQDQFLKEELAGRLGILAQVRMQRPNRFFSWLAFMLASDRTEPVWSLESLDWLAYELMGTKEFADAFPKISEYFQDDEIKRFALAGKVVRLVDKYQEFRPEIIDGWRNDKGNDPVRQDERQQIPAEVAGNAPDPHVWQGWLYSRMKEKLDNRMPDKTLLKAEIEQALQSEEKKKWIGEQVGHLYVYGSISLSPYHLDLLELVSKYVDVSIYRWNLPGNGGPNSSPAANWAKGIHNTWEAITESFPEAPVETLGEQQIPTEQEAGSLLHLIQQEFLQQGSINGNGLETGRITYNPTDMSLEFHSCHTRIREVEALYNYLLRQIDNRLNQPQHTGSLPFQENPLGSREVLVLVPDLDPYIPAIKTVFDTAPYKIPYQVATHGFSREESFWSALERLLSLGENEFTAPRIFQLIESKPIMEHFGFQDSELIRKIISDALIKRELEGDAETETRFFSFRYGLKKLVYGYFLGEDDLLYNDGNEEFFTSDCVEGQQAGDLARLYHFVDLLAGMIEDRVENRSLVGWQQWISSVAESFLTQDEETTKSFQQLIQQLGTVGSVVDKKISFRLFFHRFREQLGEQDLQRVKGRGGVTFSGILPGRSLPKKIIAFMGMNFREFPRTATKPSFDLLTNENPGLLDPNPRLSDQGNFLEAFLHAGEGVFISFQGRSEDENKEKPASTVVEELIGYVANRIGKKPDELVVSHPLHAHSTRYNREEEIKLRNYLSKAVEGSDFFKSLSDDDQAKQTGSIDIDRLGRFLSDPFKYYYNEVLGIYYESRDAALEETEMFRLDNKLDEWKVKDYLLHNEADPLEGMTEEGWEAIRKRLSMKGFLPLRNTGHADLMKAWEEIEPTRKAFLEQKGGQKPQQEQFMLELPNELPKLSGKLDKFGNGEYFFITTSKNKPKYKVQVYVRLLVLSALGKPARVWYFNSGEKDKKSGAVAMEATLDIPREEALARLVWLAGLMVESKKRLMPFYLDFKFKPEEVAEWGKEGLLKEISKKMADQYFFPSMYLKKHFEKGLLDTIDVEKFKEAWKKIFEPINNI